MGRPSSVPGIEPARDTEPELKYVCARCQTTNFTNGDCSACGSPKNWRPVPAPPIPSAQLEAEERERLRLEELRQAELDAEYRARQQVAFEAEKARLDRVLQGENKRAMDEHKAMIDGYAAAIARLDIRVVALEALKP